MKVLCVQSPRIPLEEALPYLNSLKKEIGQLSFDFLVLPEKWITTSLTTDEEDWAKIISVFKEISREHLATVVPGSYSIQREDGLYNSAPVIIEGKLVGFQDKIALYKIENGKYKSGKEIHVFEAGDLKFAVPVCYDLDFPYYAKMAVERGADFLVNPSLVTSDFSEMWYIYVKGRSLENRLPVISVNSLSEPFGGGSMVTRLHPRNGGVILESITMNKEHFSLIETNSNELREYVADRKAEDFGLYSLKK